MNFRSGPGTNYEIISTLQAGSQIFIVTDVPENDFYNVIDIATDKEGYLHKSFVKFSNEVETNKEPMFSVSDELSSGPPQLAIYNNTTIPMTLKLNNEKYLFNPQERKTITTNAGNCLYRASAPGIIPEIGNEKLMSNYIYEWEFIIVTKY